MNNSIFVETLQAYGGSFVKRLAAALSVADPKNFERLINAFPELIEKYGPSSDFYQSIESKYLVMR